jgi:hypothetical protein
MPKDYGMINEYIVVKSPTAATTAAWASSFVDLQNALSCTFLVSFGVLTAASTSQALLMTVEASSTDSTNALSLPVKCNYRISAAVDTNTWGAVTAMTTAAGGITATSANAQMTYLINVDPVDAANAVASGLGRWVHVVGAPTQIATDTLAVTAIVKPRYIQTSPVSAS